MRSFSASMRAMMSRDDGGVAAARRQAAADHLNGAAHARQRVLHLVRDHRRHLAEPARAPPARAAAPRSGRASLRSCRMPVNLRSPPTFISPTDRCSGNVVPSLRSRRDLAADADDLGLAGREIAREVAVVLLVIGRRHQHADIAADDLVCGIAEQPLGAGVERLDAAAGVDHDDAVDGRIDDRQQPRIQFLEFGGAGVYLRLQVIGAMQELRAGRARSRGRWQRAGIARRGTRPHRSRSRSRARARRRSDRGTRCNITGKSGVSLPLLPPLPVGARGRACW